MRVSSSDCWRCCCLLPRRSAAAAPSRAITPLALSRASGGGPLATTRLWSPSELVQFTESPWASWLERLSRDHPEHEWASRADPPDQMLEMLARKGHQAEGAVLRDLFLDRGLRLVDLSGQKGTAAERAEATAAAMREGVDVIYQAPLLKPPFYGVADFVIRADLEAAWASQAEAPGMTAPNVAAPSGTASVPNGALAPVEASGATSLYTVWDAKLSRRERPGQLLQLCCYAEMLGDFQGGVVPEAVALLLGGRSPQLLRVRLE